MFHFRSSLIPDISFALFVDSGFKFSAEYQQDKSAATDAE
jgi:hypothetical protein